MQALEVIRVRLFDPDKKGSLFRALEQMDRSTLAGPEGLSAQLIQHSNVEGDWALQIYHMKKPKAKSRIGSALAETFRSIGMVHHSLWLIPTQAESKRFAASGGNIS